MAYYSRSKYPSQIVLVHLALWTPHHSKHQREPGEFHVNTQTLRRKWGLARSITCADEA